MCGRTSLFAPRDYLRSRFGASVPDSYRPRYNIAPTEPVEVITAEAPGEIQRFYWGLKPEWADADDEGFINARAESAAEKPAFVDAWESRPCLVLSSGFYEWEDTARGPKQPHRVYREGGGGRSPSDSPLEADEGAVFAMAGLYERWEGNGTTLDTVTILTTEPNALVEPLHHRMAVVLPPDEEEAWLQAGPEERRTLCRPYPGEDLDAYPVSTTVNDPSNDSPGVVEPDRSEQTGLGDF